MIHERAIIRDLVTLAEEHEKQAENRGTGTRENNPRVAAYLTEQASILRSVAEMLKQQLEAAGTRHGYQW